MNMEPIPTWLKRFVMVCGALLALPGLPLLLNLVCIFPLIVLSSGFDLDMAIYGIASLTLVLLTVGAGGMAFLHGLWALRGKPSRPLGLPPAIMLVGAFGVVIVLGWFILETGLAPALFFPPVMFLAAALPPLWAVAWFIPKSDTNIDEQQGESVELPPAQNQEILESKLQLTWRRGLLAFAGGATLGVFVAILLEVLLPLAVLSLVFDLSRAVMGSLEALFRSLAGANVAAALSNPGFWYLFLQIAVIAPLAEEFAKPLAVLPLVKHLSKQETFWLGALAGAGFAALENVIYATAGFPLWAGILLVRALGGALHPLGAGLVALAWRDVLRGEPNAWGRWFLRFGIAVTVHAVWNGGSLLVLTLGGAGFFGKLPPEIDLLGLSAAGTTLAFLLLLGLSALWIGRAYGHGHSPSLLREANPTESDFTFSDRALALWAFACLAAIVPAGIAGLKLWLR